MNLVDEFTALEREMLERLLRQEVAAFSEWIEYRLDEREEPERKATAEGLLRRIQQ